MLKKTLLILFFGVSCALYSQQLTRFAVVDLPKVYTDFFRDSRPVREFNERSARVQNEIDRRTREVTELRARYSEAVLKGDQTEANRLEGQVYRMNEALKDYYQTQTAILEDQRKKLMLSGSFLDQVYDEIRYIAESEGYSMVINLGDTKGIVWYSATVDITERLIHNLRTKSGRN
ncbi:MAG: OmpH family outer membrane protein [Spirochaetes bacterium]|nr:OmpH family outer membrane protein [Brevinematales bacterium]MCL1960146.1 OmpH family outer membrane protein [Spirochaetota bacterium]